MRLYISDQLIQLAGATAVGICLGLIYDIFRVLRRNTKNRLLGIFWDILFWLCVCLSLFTLGMSLGKGSLRIFMTVFATLGFAVYMLLPSRAVLFVLDKAADLFKIILRPIKKLTVRSQNFAKNTFQKCIQWFKLKSRSRSDTDGGNSDENKGLTDADYHNSACNDLCSNAFLVGSGQTSGVGDLDSGAEHGDKRARGGKRTSRILHSAQKR